MLVSFVQVNFQQGPKDSNSYYLPYTVGALWSYAYSFESIQRSCILGDVIFRREPIEKTALKLSHSTIIGFSTYVWNRNYNYTLAKRIKELNPNCILVFGGPEIPITSSTLFKDYPFMDYVIKKEGEIVFKELLENIYDPSNVKGLLINRKGKIYDTGNADRIEDLSKLPSPYALGFFDKIVQQHPNIEWAATLETNRGCPYQCTFCDWGSLTYSKIKKFGLEKVFGEIEWMGQNNCGFVFVADANFGIFPDRDNLIIDKIVEVQNKYGYPTTFTFSWAKNQKQDVVDMTAKLMSTKSFNNGLTISVQSLNETVLDNIKRKNLNEHKIQEIFSLCEEKNIPLITEIILGLPGETLETWKDSIFKIFESGNHTGVDITQLELLENAEMNLVQKGQYQIETIPVYDYLGVSNDNILESIDVVKSTKDMPFEDMLDAQFFNCFINTFHIGGYSTILSRFLTRYKNISYKDFYNNLYSFIKDDDWFASLESEIKQDFATWMTQGCIKNSYVADIELHGYNLIYKILFKIHLESKYNHVFNLLENYLALYSLDKCLESNLINFQKNFIVKHTDLGTQKKLTFDYNIYEYIQKNEPILKTKKEYNFVCNEDKFMSFQKFLELIYFGRRRNFGKYIVDSTSI